MKTFLLRLLLMLVLVYGLCALAFGLLLYPTGERPDVGTILGDFNADVGALFRPKAAPAPGPGAGTPSSAAGDASTNLDRLRGDVGADLDLSMDLGRILVPGTTAHLQKQA